MKAAFVFFKYLHPFELGWRLTFRGACYWFLWSLIQEVQR